MNNISAYTRIAFAAVGIVLYLGLLYMVARIGSLSILALEKYLGM